MKIITITDSSIGSYIIEQALGYYLKADIRSYCGYEFGEDGDPELWEDDINNDEIVVLKPEFIETDNQKLEAMASGLAKTFPSKSILWVEMSDEPLPESIRNHPGWEVIKFDQYDKNTAFIEILVAEIRKRIKDQ